jgi:hypothetical protein
MNPFQTWSFKAPKEVKVGFQTLDTFKFLSFKFRSYKIG